MKKIFILVLGVGLLYVLNYSKPKDVVESSKSNILKNSNTISMMIETDNDGIYEVSKESSWPTNGYIFNEKLSKCENGGNLIWDNTKNIVKMTGETSDKCYVYFDKYQDPTLASVCTNGDSLVECIKSFANKGADISKIYYHNSALTNGAGDNSYRFAGPSDSVNNYVCFGYNSTSGTCPTDNLYRIIGVFDNQIKLIKYDYPKSALLKTDGDYDTIYGSCEDTSDRCDDINKGENLTTEIGSYYYNYKNSNSSSNVWSTSLLNSVNLNTNFLNTFDTVWKSKIATATWKVGGNTPSNINDVVPAQAFKNEITTPAKDTTYDAKIGLMYVSDYGFAASPSAWTTALSDYSGLAISGVNWMYMGLQEWTIIPRSDSSIRSFAVSDSGDIFVRASSLSVGVRPVFYLNPYVVYASGTGTKTNPIIISS